MSRFLPYSPEQAYLIPPDVQAVLGRKHLCFFVHEVVERMDLSSFEQAYGEQGGVLYHPALLLKVWLYGYALGITSSRRLEQRVREDLAFRYLAAGAQPDYWALNAFRRRHARGINDVFTQVLELARQMGLGRLGTVAIDSTRIKASASPQRVDVIERQRQGRVRLRRQVRRWQQQCQADDPNQGAGTMVAVETDALPAKLPPLEKLRRSRTDPEARFLRARQGFVLGYSAEIAVNQDHLIVAARVTQQPNDSTSLLPMVEEVERVARARPRRVLADSGFHSNQNVVVLEQRGIQVYMPDSRLAGEMNRGAPAYDDPHFSAGIHRMRQKLRSRRGRRIYDRRKTLVEPVFGVLKEQRSLRTFRLRGLQRVGIEFTLAAVAYNLTRLFHCG